LTNEFGEPFYDRVEAKASPEQKEKLKKLSASQIKEQELAGDKIENILTVAPGNNASIGGLKATTKNGWFAARPSGTEDIYKIYAESFLSNKHLKEMIDEAQTIVNTVLQNH
ncbi:MAG: alpha-D-glucose phosphate-specific phosphoglucomutase, partial [Bacteroidota bacterium]